MEEDPVCDYDDLSEEFDQSLISELTEADIKPVEPEGKAGLSVREQKANVLIYIIFTHYRKEVEEICRHHSCDIRLSMSSYMISNRSAEEREEFGRCCKQVEEFINSINYEKLGETAAKKSLHLSEKGRYTHSPYFSSAFKEKHIYLTIFHDEVYAFSRKLQPKEMLHEITSFTKNKYIFPVRFNKENPKYGFNENSPHINLYLNKLIDFYSEFILERNIVVEINFQKTFIYVIGERQKYLMEVKQTFKNVVESMVCLVVKNTGISEKHLIKFLEKASTFPIHYGRLSETKSVIISKDNILRQLISKSTGFFKYLGVDLALSSNEGGKPRFGIYITPSLSCKIKIEKARDICKEKGCDLFNNSNIYFINQVFHHEKQETNEEVRTLLCKVMQSLEENKQKFETMSRIKQSEEPKTNALNPLKYSLKGGRCPDKALSELLRRDVLREKVQMKKEFLIAFNVLETKEKVQYWRMMESGEEGEEVGEGELKPGKYLRGLKKTAEDGSAVYMLQEIVEVI